ncbi:MULTISPECIES: general stress protein [Bosea]|uniref:general stress protein n=1 Tax=Bosea TaxID=85413 RepID=UPI00215029CF|nr:MULTISPECIES: general stress protein [Bosea]MCR4524660.1 hypothetical protein [Bosea sp. 47.2.35]MDR6831358.1 uncharacterized protein YcfJ [Bosea robiniae]MDR6898075.1 uncharacterized protein YcfJ [Bosea sp. BE109]MDR7141494.1 uncharacterized protein YcfJ [Bosea sp. BE168]
MTRTLTRTYDNYETARSVVEQLEAAGVSSNDISVVGRAGTSDETNATEGAGIGAGIGGAAGLLAGIGMLAIPGVGPVVAAGWLASTAAGAVAGAAAGGLVGSFVKEGHDKDEADYYAETVRRGGSVVSVRTEPEHEATVQAILDGATPIDRATREAEYRAGGWERFDETADPYRPPVV